LIPKTKQKFSNEFQTLQHRETCLQNHYFVDNAKLTAIGNVFDTRSGKQVLRYQRQSLSVLTNLKHFNIEKQVLQTIIVSQRKAYRHRQRVWHPKWLKKKVLCYQRPIRSVPKNLKPFNLEKKVP